MKKAATLTTGVAVVHGGFSVGGTPCGIAVDGDIIAVKLTTGELKIYLNDGNLGVVLIKIIREALQLKSQTWRMGHLIRRAWDYIRTTDGCSADQHPNTDWAHTRTRDLTVDNARRHLNAR